MADLKTDYQDDVLDTSVNEKRKYKLIQNEDGTVSFEDVTEYTQTGDSFGSKDMNDTNAAVNLLNSNLKRTNGVVSIDSDIGSILSVNCDYYENGIYHIDVSINVTVEIPGGNAFLALLKNGQPITLTRRIDGALESTSGRYNICLLPNTKSFLANGSNIPIGFYKLKMDVAE